MGGVSEGSGRVRKTGELMGRRSESASMNRGNIGWLEIGEVGRQGVICNLYFLVNKIENLESTYAAKWDRGKGRVREESETKSFKLEYGVVFILIFFLFAGLAEKWLKEKFLLICLFLYRAHKDGAFLFLFFSQVLFSCFCRCFVLYFNSTVFQLAHCTLE